MTFGTGLLTGLGAPVSLGVASSQRPRSRLLYSWRGRDAALTALTGQAGTITRASAGTTVDRNGVVHAVAQHQPRWCAVDTDGDGVRDDCGLIVERASANLVKDSEAIGGTANWSLTGTITRTAAAHTAAGVSLDLLDDTSTLVASTYSQDVVGLVAPTSGQVGVSVLVRRGTATQSAIRMKAGSNARLLAYLTWDAASAPVVTMAVGVHLLSEPLADGVWRLHLQAVGVVTAEVNGLVIYPAAATGLTVGATGSVYIGGAQVEALAAPTSYIRTAGAAATRAADIVTYPLLFAPHEITLYARIARPAWVGVAAAAGYRTLLSVSLTSALLYDRNSGGLGGHLATDSGTTTATASIPAGPLVDAALRVAIRSGNTITVETDAGSVQSSVAPGALTAWAAAQIGLGSQATADRQVDAVLLEAKVASGLRSLAFMRSAL